MQNPEVLQKLNLNERVIEPMPLIVAMKRNFIHIARWMSGMSVKPDRRMLGSSSEMCGGGRRRTELAKDDRRSALR